MNKIAILVDGGFYRKVASYKWGYKTGEERAKELCTYCMAHVGNNELYRIFYYDCPPLAKQIYHPYLKKTINLATNNTYQWTLSFLDTMKSFRKFALRLGEISEISAKYVLKDDILKDLCKGKIKIDDITDADFNFEAKQKGVDMRIGLDIASISYKKQVNQIILISGDSDFVPAAKLARREGIDFILDPMWQNIRPDLREHIDGLQSQWKHKKKPENK